MKILRKMDWDRLSHEYGVYGTRLLPWDGVCFPFGGAWCVVEPGTQSLDHINDPCDEDELFIVISGCASVVVGGDAYYINKGDLVFIPAGKSHYIINNTDEEFHFYTIWWNTATVSTYSSSLYPLEETN